MARFSIGTIFAVSAILTIFSVLAILSIFTVLAINAILYDTDGIPIANNLDATFVIKILCRTAECSRLHFFNCIKACSQSKNRHDCDK